MDILIGIISGAFGLFLLLATCCAVIVGFFYAVYQILRAVFWVASLGPPQIPVPASWRKDMDDLFKDDEKPRDKQEKKQDKILEETLGTEGVRGMDHIYLEDAPPLI